MMSHFLARKEVLAPPNEWWQPSWSHRWRHRAAFLMFFRAGRHHQYSLLSIRQDVLMQ